MKNKINKYTLLYIRFLKEEKDYAKLSMSRSFFINYGYARNVDRKQLSRMCIRLTVEDISKEGWRKFVTKNGRFVEDCVKATLRILKKIYGGKNLDEIVKFFLPSSYQEKGIQAYFESICKRRDRYPSTIIPQRIGIMDKNKKFIINGEPYYNKLTQPKWNVIYNILSKMYE